MIGTLVNSKSICFSFGFPSTTKWNSHSHSHPHPTLYFLTKLPTPCSSSFHQLHSFSLLSTLPINLSFHNNIIPSSNFSFNASSSSSASVGSAEHREEPATNVKFQTSLTLPGCSGSLSLLGTGYREKVFAIIGVKVYAAGLYINPSILTELNSWRGRSATAIQEDSSLFNFIFQSPSEKSIQIVLVRDVDGKTFWDALDDAISPRIKAPIPIDVSALTTFRSIFQGRSLKKGTFIFLTWLEPPKMLVSISVGGPPSGIEATIESTNVTSALFDVFFGDSSVSPTLKASVSTGLATILK